MGNLIFKVKNMRSKVRKFSDETQITNNTAEVILNEEECIVDGITCKKLKNKLFHDKDVKFDDKIVKKLQIRRCGLAKAFWYLKYYSYAAMHHYCVLTLEDGSLYSIDKTSSGINLIGDFENLTQIDKLQN